MKDWEEIGLGRYYRIIGYVADQPIKRWGLTFEGKVILPANYQRISGPWGNPGWSGGASFGLYHEDGRVGVGHVAVPFDGTVKTEFFEQYPRGVRVSWFGNGVILLKDVSEMIIERFYISSLFKKQ